MKKLLLFALLSCTFIADAHRPAFKVWSTPIHDIFIPDLNIDINKSMTVEVPQGTYRIVTNSGPTTKYIKFVFDGAIRRDWASFTCFFLKNTEEGYDKILCMDVSKIHNHDFDLNL